MATYRGVSFNHSAQGMSGGFMGFFQVPSLEADKKAHNHFTNILRPYTKGVRGIPAGDDPAQYEAVADALVAAKAFIDAALFQVTPTPIPTPGPTPTPTPQPEPMPDEWKDIWGGGDGSGDIWGKGDQTAAGPIAWRFASWWDVTNDAANSVVKVSVAIERPSMWGTTAESFDMFMAPPWRHTTFTWEASTTAAAATEAAIPTTDTTESKEDVAMPPASILSRFLHWIFG